MGTSAGNWSPFYEKTRNSPHHALVEEAAAHVTHRGRALDVGAGALRDSKYLLSLGFEVTALDASEYMIAAAASVDSPNFLAIQSAFADFDFGVAHYDLVSAMYSLPFCEPAEFDPVFERIVESLKVGGVFSGILFGDRDTWATNPEMTFHTRAQAQARLAGLETIKFDEIEEDGETTVGVPKHWHTFHFIVRKA